MVLSVDEARSAPAGRRHRLLHRALLVAALAAGGWLLSVLFATSASATEEPSVTGIAPAAEQPGTATGLAVGGVASTSTGVAEVFAEVQRTVTHTVAALGQAATEATQTDIRGEHSAPQVAGSQAIARNVPRAAEQAAPRSTVPHRPPATPAHPASVATAPEHHPGPAAPPSRAEHAPTATHPDEQVGTHVPTAPAKPPAPAAPSATSMSGSADNAGGARGASSEPSTQAPLPSPSAAGYTTRSRAAEATGRVDGLPATSPD